jgi:hypothetical protein
VGREDSPADKRLVAFKCLNSSPTPSGIVKPDDPIIPTAHKLATIRVEADAVAVVLAT